MLRERTRYGFTHVVGHLRWARRTEKLFDLIEDKGFLADQAAQLGGFQQSSRDLELHVLPEAIGRSEWERFLRLALVAVNFRGLAQALSEHEILVALVRRGQKKLAGNLVSQLADPERRARARAVVLGASIAEGTADASGDELDRLCAELNGVPSPIDEGTAEAWLETITVVAGQLPPALVRDRWPDWIGRLAEGSQCRVRTAWKAIAESWIEHDFGADPGLWQALGAIGDSQHVRRLLIRRLSTRSNFEGELLDSALPSPFSGDEELLWLVRLRILGRRLEDGEVLAGEVREILAAMPSVRSMDLLDLGTAIWAHFDREDLTEIENRIEDPVAHAGLRVAMFEQEPSAERGRAARAALDTLPQGPAWLHWSLRYLGVGSVPPKEIARYLRRLIRYLGSVRYRAGADDLVRFLDLIGSHLPARLRRQVGNIVWAPAHGPETLRCLAAGAGPTVAEELLQRAERYADAISATESEGFELRREMLTLLFRRFCCEWGDMARLDEAQERLLPAEEDRLRSEVAEGLAAGNAIEFRYRDPTWRRVVAGIRSPRLRLLSSLRGSFDRDDLDELLAPSALYEAVVRTNSVDDELQALAPLSELPCDPSSLIREHLDRVNDEGRQVFGLIDLARHTLAFRRRIYPPDQVDAIAVLQPLGQAVEGLVSDRLLLALTPELVELGAEVGPGRAYAELREAFVRLLQLESVPWTQRREVLEFLLARFAQRTSVAPGGVRLLERPRRATGRFFLWLHRQAVQTSSEESSRRWQELAPSIAAAERRWTDEARDNHHEDEGLDTATLVAGRRWGPLDPLRSTLCRALWEAEGPDTLRSLARLTLSSLSENGPSAGEDALRLWLNAYLKPRFGQACSAARKRWNLAAAATCLARSLEPPGRAVEPPGPARAVPGQRGRSEEPGRPSSSRRKRILEVYWRYLEARRKAPRSVLLEKPPRLALMISFVLAILFPLVDFAFWPSLRGTPSPDVPGPPPGWLLVLLLGTLFLVNALVIDRYLTWTTKHPGPVRGWVRALRFALAGLPIVGLWTVVFWRRIDSDQIRWAFQAADGGHAPASSGGSTERSAMVGRRAFLPTWSGGRGSSGSTDSIAFLTLFNWIASFVLAGSLAVSARDELESLLGIALLAVVVHVIGFAMSLYVFRYEAHRTRLSRPGSRLLCSLSLLWLLPFPGLAIAGVFLLILSELYILGLRKAPKGLVYRAFEQGDDLLRRLPSRLGLARDLRASLAALPLRRRVGSWVQELERPKDRGEMASRTLWLYRSKVFFLAFDATLLTLLVQRAFKDGTAAYAVVGRLREVCESGSLALGSFGILAALCIRLAKPLRERLSELVQPLRYLGVTQVILAVSLRLGAALVETDSTRFGTVLLAASGVGLLMVAVKRAKEVLPTQPDEAEADDIYDGSWLFVFFALLFVGSFFQENGASGPAYLGLVEVPVQWLPVLGMLASSLLLKRFLQPFRPRQILLKGLPTSLRGVLAALTAVVVLPLGGLALPVLVAYRRRRWPEIELWWIDQRMKSS